MKRDTVSLYFSFGILFCASETIPLSPPRFMVSTADDGTITSAPFSFKAFEEHVHGAQGADVFTESFAPGVVERMGFGYEAVRRINPGII